MTTDVVDTEEQPLTVKEAISLLSSLDASQVLPILRHTDFMMLAGLAFAGFRQDSGGYGNPIVRRRLAEEAAKNAAFAKKLRDLAKAPKRAEAPQVPAPLPRQASSTNLQQIDRESEKYRAERDRLKSERDAAVASRQAAERQLTEAKRETAEARAEKVQGEREVERLRQRLERVERKQRQLEATNAALRKASILPPATPSLPSNPVTEKTPTPPVSSDHHFAEAVRHLLGKQKEAVAISIVSDVLRASPDDVDAISIKADALIRLGNGREAVPALRTLISLLLKRDSFSEAVSALSKLLLTAEKPSLEAKSVRDFMLALPRCTEDVGKAAEPLVALRSENPIAFEVIKSLTPPAWVSQLFPEYATFAPDSALPLAIPSLAGLTLTARRLVAAIDRNDVPIVELAREAIAEKDSEERKKILDSVVRAADNETVYEYVLHPKITRGPIVVDGSNVAWHGHEHNANQQPRLNYILAIRKALWYRGYFPVILIADANLPFVVNDPQTARKMVDDEQIHLVLGGSDADEHILREAQRLMAPIVTNDYMVDWDPDQVVTKFQYSFSPEGRPTVYF